MTLLELHTVVINLNDSIEESCEDVKYYFHLESSGEYMRIMFQGIELWNSVEDEREYLDEKEEEYEPLEPYVKRKFNEFVDEVQKCKFK